MKLGLAPSLASRLFDHLSLDLSFGNCYVELLRFHFFFFLDKAVSSVYSHTCVLQCAAMIRGIGTLPRLWLPEQVPHYHEPAMFHLYFLVHGNSFGKR